MIAWWEDLALVFDVGFCLFWNGDDFSEAVLAQIYRHKTSSGALVGGPRLLHKEGLNAPVLSMIFAVFGIIAMGVG